MISSFRLFLIENKIEGLKSQKHNHSVSWLHDHGFEHRVQVNYGKAIQNEVRNKHAHIEGQKAGRIPKNQPFKPSIEFDPDANNGRPTMGNVHEWDKKISHQIIDELATHFDPTPNKQYTEWLINRYKKKEFRLEDDEGIRKSLQLFHDNKNHPDMPFKDIGGKSVAELHTAVQPFKTMERKLTQAQLDQIRKEGLTTVHDGPKLRIDHLKTHRASRVCFGHTNWCTAYESPQNFNEYTKDGPLYVIHDKQKGQTLWQFHFPSSQFMYKDDSPIDLENFTEEFPEVRNVKAFKPHLDIENHHDHFYFMNDKERKKALDKIAGSKRSTEYTKHLVVYFGNEEHHRKLLDNLQPDNLFMRQKLAHHTKNKEVLRNLAHDMRDSKTRNHAKFRLETEFKDSIKDPLAGYQHQFAQKGSEDHLKALHAATIDYLEMADRAHNSLETQTWADVQANKLTGEFRQHFPHFAKIPQHFRWHNGRFHEGNLRHKIDWSDLKNLAIENTDFKTPGALLAMHRHLLTKGPYR